MLKVIVYDSYKDPLMQNVQISRTEQNRLAPLLTKSKGRVIITRLSQKLKITVTK